MMNDKAYWLHLPKGAIFEVYDERPSFSTNLFYILLAKAFSFSICWIVGLIKVPGHPTHCLYRSLTTSLPQFMCCIPPPLCAPLQSYHVQPSGGFRTVLDPLSRAELSFLFHNISRCCHTYYNGSIIWYFIDPQGTFLFPLGPFHREVRGQAQLCSSIPGAGRGLASVSRRPGLWLPLQACLLEMMLMYF